MSKVTKPVWYQPGAQKDADSVTPQLRVKNTFTKKEDVFVPANGKSVTWYSCGPTVYDASHLGHARTYISFDILRRIMEDYFGYDVTYVMNITDIDDKIILAARQQYLFNKAKSEINDLSEEVISKVQTAFDYYVSAKLADLDKEKNLPNWAAFSAAHTTISDPKLDMYFKISKKAFEGIETAKKALKNNDNSQAVAVELLAAAKDVYSEYLDSLYKADVTDHKVFRDFAKYWEIEFFKDMDMLNIRRADIITRVSEYVPEIIAFVEKIISNGYGYESNGSVYFDTDAFSDNENHQYPKLEPSAKGNSKLLDEGEGSLASKAVGDKRNPADFALWKKSKAGEPSWDSPWGPGRPGWHIECSAMASEILGENMDIHSGGVDLTFPHHDNELAQSEAYFDNKQWVNYFLHTGHLHIEGLKMSKSLKNFVTIREALEKMTPTQLRIMFLHHAWDKTLDYSERSLNTAKSYEKDMNNFITNVSAIVRENRAVAKDTQGKHNFRDSEKQLLTLFHVKQKEAHVAICDNFDTPQLLRVLRELVSGANTYMLERAASANEDLLEKIAKYILRIHRILGIAPDLNVGLDYASSSTGGSATDNAAAFVRVLSSFRDKVRSLARSNADPKELLALSDKIRDEDLVNLGVRLDDRDDGKALIKFIDRETLIRERDEKLQKELQKQKEKEDRLRELERKKLEKLEKGKTPPSLLFKDEEGLKLYSQFDEQGIPTHMADGSEVTKSAKKKLQKLFDAQAKLHDEYNSYIASLSKN